MTRRGYFKIFLIILFQSFALAQTTHFEYKDLGVSVDFARFTARGGVFLEVYLSVPRQNLTFIANDKGLDADVIYQVALIQDSLVQYGPERWQRNFKVGSIRDSRQKAFIPEIASFSVFPGDYILRIDVFDMKGEVRQQINKDISLQLFSEKDLNVSDIQIASNIIETKQENEFSKYGNDFIPNAELLFDAALPNLYYFFEIYNLNKNEDYLFEILLKDREQKIVDVVTSSVKTIPATSTIEMGRTNLIGVESGKYSLDVMIKSQKDGKSASQSKEFYTHSVGKEKENSRIIDFDPVQLAIDNSVLIEMLRVFIDPQKYKAIIVADKALQQELINETWNNLEILYPQESGSFKKAFFRRIDMAKQYAGFKKEGWQTDRGRVLRQYGPPDEIESHDFGLAEKPWEVWYYHNMQGGVEFIFLSRSGYGEMELVHSTARGEVYFTEWTKWIN